MKNNLVIKILRQVADLLEIKGEVIYKIRAYRRAADSIKLLTEDIEKIAEEGKLEEIPGIGKAISEKILEIIQTGSLGYLEKLTREIPISVTELIRIEGIGGKTAGKLYKELGIKSIEELEAAIEKGELLKLSGFTPKTVEKILNGIKFLKTSRTALPIVEPIAHQIRDFLEATGLLTAVVIGGSIRRRKSTIRDIDLHAVSDQANFEKVMDLFTTMEKVESVIVRGPVKSTIKLTNGIDVDLRLLEEESFGSGLIYSTGSKNHTIKLRVIAEKRGLRQNEYGIFDAKNGKLIASKTEEEVYKALGMAFIPPELREDRGEVEAAMKNALPKLIELKDIKADFHIHTDWTDGKSSLKEMILGAVEKNYEYLIIADHGGELPITNPLDEGRFFRQRKEIEKITKDLDLIVLHGIEANITKTGEIDIPKSLLKEMDFVVASVHSHFNMSTEEMTERILKAMDNEYVNGIGHPTGRQIGKRPGFTLDFSRIAAKCQETNTALEINSLPDRQDIDDYIVFDLRGKIDLYISTDSHSVRGLDNIQLGLNIARRGWCEKKDVMNTLTYKELKRKLGLIN